jgi:hypothetical protein
MRGRGSLRFKTASCCRRVKFSKRRSRRERKNTITGTGESFTRHSTRAVFHGNMVHWIPAHLRDSTADRYFGEPQHSKFSFSHYSSRVQYRPPMPYSTLGWRPSWFVFSAGTGSFCRRFLPSLCPESICVLLWTLAVASVYRKSKQGAVTIEGIHEASANEPRNS